MVLGLCAADNLGMSESLERWTNNTAGLLWDVMMMKNIEYHQPYPLKVLYVSFCYRCIANISIN